MHRIDDLIDAADLVATYYRRHGRQVDHDVLDALIQQLHAAAQQAKAARSGGQGPSDGSGSDGAGSDGTTQ